jgi:hypothetical protein
MSGDGKRSVAKWPKLPRPSSTLPFQTSHNARSTIANGIEADVGQKGLLCAGAVVTGEKCHGISASADLSFVASGKTCAYQCGCDPSGWCFIPWKIAKSCENLADWSMPTNSELECGCKHNAQPHSEMKIRAKRKRKTRESRLGTGDLKPADLIAGPVPIFGIECDSIPNHFFPIVVRADALLDV